jgi:hypothetical protein
MFKKTLLALTVAGASLSANAGILSAEVKETADIVNDVKAANYTSCTAAASALGVTATGTSKDTAAADALTIEEGASAKADTYDSVADTVVFTGADACTVTINSDELVSAADAKYSQEGAEAVGLTIAADLVAGVGGFSSEDTIVFTVTGGTVDEDASAEAVLENTTDFTLLGVQGNTILFTVNNGDSYDGRAILSLTGLVVKPDSGSDSIELSAYVQNTANVKYDSADGTEITKIAKQFSAETFVAADGIIDVATERFKFESQGNDDSSAKAVGEDGVAKDTLVVKVNLDTTQGNLAANEEAEVVIEGNFAWLKDYEDEDGDIDFSNAVLYKSFTAVDSDGALVTSGQNTLDDVKLNSAMNKLTLTIDTSASDEFDKYQVIQFVPLATDDSATSLETTEFKATIMVTSSETAADTPVTLDKDVELNVTEDLAVGEWTLNGSVVEVPYIPFGPNTQPIIRHTNTGVQTGDISVRYMVEELTSEGHVQSNEWVSLGVLVEDAKPGVRNLLDVITEALEAELMSNKFKVALEITTNVPAEDVTVYAAAKISAEGQDRLTIGAFSSQSQNEKK